MISTVVGTSVCACMCVCVCSFVCVRLCPREAAVTAYTHTHTHTNPEQHNMACCHFHSVIAASTQSAKMHPPPRHTHTHTHIHLHTHTHTYTHSTLLSKSQPKIASRGSDGAVISLKIHSCKILLFKPPSPLFNSLIHLSLDCKTKHALSSASQQEPLCPRTHQPSNVCVSVCVCVCFPRSPPREECPWPVRPACSH